ncbi:MAG: hypothetical protein Kow0037_01010 [Calditrichia bacterium]
MFIRRKIKLALKMVWNAVLAYTDETPVGLVKYDPLAQEIRVVYMNSDAEGMRDLLERGAVPMLRQQEVFEELCRILKDG